MLADCVRKFAENEEIEEVIRSETYYFVGLTRSFHVKMYASGSRTSGSFDYFSTIKVIRNYTTIKVPNIIQYGSIMINKIYYEYVISERIYGVSLSCFHDKKKVLKVIEEYRKKMLEVKVSRMGRLYFLFEVPSFPYYIVEVFPCRLAGDYNQDPKALITSRISILTITLRNIYKKYNDLGFFERYNIEQVEESARRIVEDTDIGFSLQHCDIHDDNIMISDHDEIFLVDWEVAGVYPDHYGKSRENHITGLFETENKIIMLEQILIEFCPLKDLSMVSDDHIHKIMYLLTRFMENL